MAIPRRNKETALFNPDKSVEGASRTATRYLAKADQTGVMVHPEGDETTGWKISSAIDLLKSNVSYIKLWFDSVAKLRLGADTSGHVILDNTGMEVKNPSASLAKFGTTARVGEDGSSRFLMNASSLQAYDSSNAKYFEVSAGGLTWGTNTAATTTQVNEAAKRTYVSIGVTAIDFNADTATLQATLYVDGAAKTSSVTYAWLKDGSAMSGETARTLSVTTAKGGLEHAYSCTVTY